MNSAILTELVAEFVDTVVTQLGVPRSDAEAAMRYARNMMIAAEAEARNDDQFLLDFDRHGSEELGRRFRKSSQAMRKRRAKILRKKQPPVAVAVAE